MPAVENAGAQVVRFGPFEADLRARELRKSGLKVRLEGQPFQILALLLERPGELVTREEIQHALWPASTFVDFEISINAAVKRLRQALDDSADTPRFIETLPRRGYRFIYPLTPIPTPEANAMPKKHVSLALALTVLALVVSATWQVARYVERRRVAGIDSVAVLPLENMTGDPEQQYVVDGVHDELITELAQISSLKVISRTSVMQYRQKQIPLPELASRLGVKAVLEGSVRLGGDRIRMTVQLISAQDDRHVWAHTYESEPRELTRLPAQIALNLADKLQLNLTPQERAALTSARGVDPDAWKAYFKGKYFAAKWTPDSLWKAIGYFREALDLDPSYAAAWAGMGMSYEQLAIQGQRDTIPQARQALQKAMELDPTLRGAHQVMGRIKLSEWDWEGATQEFELARQLDPNWGGPSLFLMVSGRTEEAVRAARIEAERDPLNYLKQLTLGWMYFIAGRYDDSVAQLKKTSQLDPANPNAYYELAWNHAKKGNHPEALGYCETALEKLRQRQPEAEYVGSCGWVYAMAGQRASALKIGAALEKSSNDERFVTIAHIHDALGDRERALSFLEKAYDQHSGMLLPRQWLSPMLSDEMKADPRFRELMRRTGMPWVPADTAVSATARP